MMCQHCNSTIEGVDKTCGTCGTPASSVHRRARSSKRRRAAVNGHDAQNSTAAINESSADQGNANLPAIVPGVLSATHAATRSPQSFPVPYVPAPQPARRRGMMLRGLALGSTILAASVFALSGAWRDNPQATVAASTPGPEPVASAPAADTLQRKTGSVVSTTHKTAGKGTSPAKKPPTMASKDSNTTVASRGARTGSGDAQKLRSSRPAAAPAKPRTSPAAPEAEDVNGVTLAKAPVVQSQYAQCLEFDSFLRREQCKWQACGGKWGQDGCPTYKKDDGDIYY